MYVSSGETQPPGVVLKETQISYEPDFVPEGCSTPSAGVTLGVSVIFFRTAPIISFHPHTWIIIQAGVQWQDAYDFAESQNITLVGGKLVSSESRKHRIEFEP